MFRLTAVGRVSLLLLSICMVHSQVQLYKLGVLKPSQFHALVVLMALATVLSVVVPLVVLFRKPTPRNLGFTSLIDLANLVPLYIVLMILAGPTDDCRSRYCHRIHTLMGFFMAYIGHIFLLCFFSIIVGGRAESQKKENLSGGSEGHL